MCKIVNIHVLEYSPSVYNNIRTTEADTSTRSTYKNRLIDSINNSGVHRGHQHPDHHHCHPTGQRLYSLHTEPKKHEPNTRVWNRVPGFETGYPNLKPGNTGLPSTQVTRRCNQVPVISPGYPVNTRSLALSLYLYILIGKTRQN